MTLKQFEYDEKGYLRAVPSAGEVLSAAAAAPVAETAPADLAPVDPVRSAVEPTGVWARVRATLAKWLSERPEGRLRARRLQQSLMLAGIGLR